ncbi:hypothetical protein FRB95_009617 [Tulasnella sp. JGI-2019a]|nr:hypothetical protein FRB95_009617 [Tulasnella sp. JGI-2019a]
MLSRALWLLIGSFGAGVMAQNQQVTVLMNDTRVTYGLAGQPTTLAGITNGGGPAAFLGLCGSFIGLYATDSMASLLFTGTSVTVNVLADTARGGPYDVYLDGALNQQGNNYATDGSNPFSSFCNPIPIVISNLADTVHNISVVNFNGGLQELIVQNFSYFGSTAAPTAVVSASSSSVVSSTVAPSTSSAQSSAAVTASTTTANGATGTTTDSATQSATRAAATTTTKRSKNPIIAGIIAAVVIIGIIIASFLFFRSRQQRNEAINLSPSQAYHASLHPGDSMGANKYTNAPYQMSYLNSAAPTTTTGTPANYTHHTSLTPYNPESSTLHIQDPFSNRESVTTYPSGPRSEAAESTQSSLQLPPPPPLPFGGIKAAQAPYGHQQYTPYNAPPQQAVQRESTAASSSVTQSQSQVEVIQAMLARGIPNEEISAMIRMMAAAGGSSSGGSHSGSGGGNHPPAQTLQLVEGTPPRYDFKG